MFQLRRHICNTLFHSFSLESAQCMNKMPTEPPLELVVLTFSSVWELVSLTQSFRSYRFAGYFAYRDYIDVLQ